MDLRRAEALCREMMAKHGLGSTWAFGWINRSSRTLGRCTYHSSIFGCFGGKIELSKTFVSVNEEPAVLDTILHEIAHALTPGAHHGPAWKRKCLEIGAKPERCSTSEDKVCPPARYTASCPTCGRAQPISRVLKNPWSRRFLACPPTCRNGLKFVDNRTGEVKFDPSLLTVAS
jgi:predicted SprT family Zn-dependent metalloprotease